MSEQIIYSKVRRYLFLSVNKQQNNGVLLIVSLKFNGFLLSIYLVAKQRMMKAPKIKLNISSLFVNLFEYINLCQIYSEWFFIQASQSKWRRIDLCLTFIETQQTHLACSLGLWSVTDTLLLHIIWIANQLYRKFWVHQCQASFRILLRFDLLQP